MIGYYVHHHGHGHRHRATAVARCLDVPVTGLSSVPRPADWPGDWVELPRDDAGGAVEPTAGGTLHWAPEHDDGLSERMAAVSAWIERTRPSLLVCDVSVEVALLARLHGVPVVTMVLPGVRDDVPHRTVHALARRVVAAWPEHVPGMTAGLDGVGDRMVHVGAISRFDGREPAPRTDRRPHVVVLGGTGGDADTATLVSARESVPDWRWTVLDGSAGTWDDDPWALLCTADVVVTHAGQNAVAEVAAARVPAVVVPQPRPHEEQAWTARALVAGGWPVVALEDRLGHHWPDVLDVVRRLPTERWSAWNDGGGARRLAALIEDEAAAR